MNDAVRAAEASTLSAKPATKPTRPYFSSGPCAKPPGWAAEKLATDSLGRSHRSKLGKNRLQLAIDLTREVLRVPDRSEEHTSELQSLMRISYAVFCLKKKRNRTLHTMTPHQHNKRTAPTQVLQHNIIDSYN